MSAPSQAVRVNVAQDDWICGETILRVADRDMELARLLSQVLRTLTDADRPKYITLSERVRCPGRDLFLTILNRVIGEANKGCDH